MVKIYIYLYIYYYYYYYIIIIFIISAVVGVCVTLIPVGCAAIKAVGGTKVGAVSCTATFGIESDL